MSFKEEKRKKGKGEKKAIDLGEEYRKKNKILSFQYLGKILKTYFYNILKIRF